MERFLQLTNACDMASYIESNFHFLMDFFQENYKTQTQYKYKVRSFINANYDKIESLDFEKKHNSSFLILLFDYCERFKMTAPALLISQIMSNNNFVIGERLEAAKLFLFNVHTYDDYIDRFDLIAQKLDFSLLNEEDNEKKILVTFYNYISIVIDNTAEFHNHIIQEVIKKIKFCIENRIYSFLKYDKIKDLNFLNSPVEQSNQIIQKIIEQILDEPEKKSFLKNDIIIEKNTAYSNELLKIPISFDSIRSLSLKFEKEEAFTDRGVAILQYENQLYTYMRRFGNMHKAKLISAFKYLPQNLLTSKINVYDWGCGQGIASMVFLDLFRNIQIEKIVLIEPSELSLKRAVLHLKAFNSEINVETICKKLDDITQYDFKKTNKGINLHLFSNILDIDGYSQNKLINLIENTQKGIVYFVCVSPYITDIKANKLDNFKCYFENKYESFKSLGGVNNGSRFDDDYWFCNHNYRNNNYPCDQIRHGKNGCGDKWTRVIRVFKVEL